MQDFGSAESYTPGEGGSGVSEELTEDAKQRFASQQAAAAQVRKEEQKSKKRDQGVAQAILQFLTDQQRVHLAALIAQIVGRDCPSPFLLAILSLINADCRTAAEDYLRDTVENSPAAATELPTLPAGAASREQLANWANLISRVLASDSVRIVRSLLTGDRQIDGSVLQLTTFVLQEFLQESGKTIAYEEVQPLAGNILQTVFGPHLSAGAMAAPAEEA